MKTVPGVSVKTGVVAAVAITHSGSIGRVFTELPQDAGLELCRAANRRPLALAMHVRWEVLEAPPDGVDDINCGFRWTG